ncbi:hypothetical protein CCR85_03500 [Rhodothalassium salexigens]|uniref:Uncharacterized protein n=1 Tax=Rhodothalassium salexigens DSM 2132 TaxID=1188247 RepID=A0A4R2PPN0_RHOSA|nr:hypothetical protein [Rhodothalassium salexigens]MBB4210705.1 hypothetical protein [Rhodothalassium salexigens DSM 2132]MBK1637906.1 hypothetical protein [Rhodothalassium salexigens DSM 2132]MBK5910556.1 hypothetical protein [Rhodothalassium salexigens]MBK5919884.1 hypothetical protein [Rhodothalassium salexigens]TCP37739.1 hypothetical protein EV659_102145 [Rhodothalassium salexigens DSM 2132]
MAKAAAAQAGKKSKKKRGFGSTLLFVLFILGLMVVKPAVALVTAIGLAPTLVAMIVESGEFRAVRVRTIFAFNLTGVIPYVVKYWFRSDLEMLLQDFTQMWLFIVMYGAAAAGMVVLWAAPVVVATLVQMRNFDQVKKINKVEEDLVEEWGESVRQTDT